MAIHSWVNPLNLTIGLAQSLLNWPSYQVVIMGNDGVMFQVEGYTYSSEDNIIVLSSPDNSLDTLEKVRLAKEYLDRKGQAE